MCFSFLFFYWTNIYLQLNRLRIHQHQHKLHNNLMCHHDQLFDVSPPEKRARILKEGAVEHPPMTKGSSASVSRATDIFSFLYQALVLMFAYRLHQSMCVTNLAPNNDEWGLSTIHAHGFFVLRTTNDIAHRNGNFVGKYIILPTNL
jgi:hypothetical protein